MPWRATAKSKTWIEPTIARGALIPGAGAEPFGVPPTTAKKVAGGYLVSGTKHYATNASMAEWLWLGRVASDSHPKPIMLMLHKDTPGLKIDSEAWRPTGMRACVSPWLYLKDCFVPEENLLGQPGQFLDENWMGKINFAFTANYLGSARAMYDWSLAYIRERNGGKDSYRQLRFGELKSMLDAARLILYNAVRMFKNNPNEAMIAAHEAKWMAKETLEKVMWSAGEICGSTALFVNHPLERFYRDMHLHMMHGRHDIAAQIVGACGTRRGIRHESKSLSPRRAGVPIVQNVPAVQALTLPPASRERVLYFSPSSLNASRAKEKSRTSSSGRFLSPSLSMIALISASVMVPSRLRPVLSSAS